MFLAFSNIVAADVKDFEHAVAGLPDAKALDADAFVLRVEAGLWLTLGSPSEALLAELQTQAAHVVTRAPGIEVFLMPDAHTCAESSPAHTAHRPPMQLVDQSGALTLTQANNAAVLAIRQQDLTDCIEAARTRCVVCAASDYHFALPSGAHSNQFLRLAEAFVDLRTVDRIAFWIALDIQRKLEPLKPEHPVMLVDHPSMLVLAARVQLLVSGRLRVVAFPTYPSDVETRTATFDELRRLPENCTQAFVLVGVASTGRLAKFIAQWNAPVHLKIHVSILYAIQPLELADVFCNLQLPEYRHFVSKQDCQLCIADSTAVAIHSSNYMVGYAPADAVALPPPYFNKQKEFVDRWGKHADVLRVHYNDPNEATARHHAFYVDVGTLLGIPDFVAEIEQKVATFDPPPEVVLCPDHTTAKRIAKIASGRLHVPTVVLDNNLLSKGEGLVQANLFQASRVLVVDDVFITGTKLDAINRFLREQRAKHAPRVQRIFYWTLLATPPSETEYRRRQNGLVGAHGWTASVEHLYQFPLPNWHIPSQCPWCREMDVLQAIAQHQADLDGPISSRLAKLSSPEGISDDPYFLADTVTHLPTLGAQSAVLPVGATPMQVLFACASAVQQLRHATKRLDVDQFPSPAFLARRVLAENYTERIIWLALLRSVRTRELEQPLRAFLQNAALDEHDPQRETIQNELIIAWLTGKLDAIPLSAASRDLFKSVGVDWDALSHIGLVDKPIVGRPSR